MNILLPDKPKRSHPSVLPYMDPGRYVALTKYDGWGSLIEIRDSQINVISRAGGPLPVCSEIKEHIECMVRNEQIPKNTILWGEWMDRRPDYDGPECIVLFSPVYIRGEFVGGRPFIERFNWLLNLEIPSDVIDIKESKDLPDNKLITPLFSHTDFFEFFEAQKNLPRSEGIVMYARDGQYYGHPSKSVCSPDMAKFKYRDGDSGRTLVA